MIEKGEPKVNLWFIFLVNSEKYWPTIIETKSNSC